MALRIPLELGECAYDHDGVRTLSSEMQADTEELVEVLIATHKAEPDLLDGIILRRQNHIAYLRAGLSGLSQRYQCLDASRPWLVYWIVHSLDLLGYVLTDKEQASCVVMLGKCQSRSGGFGGGPGQLPHLAPTYAAVSALCVIGTEDAYRVVNRETMFQFLSSLHTENGEFQMHRDGEIDVRGAYCAASTAVLLSLPLHELFRDTGAWIAKCQTYDGGVAAEPDNEAHGGYAFCGLAAAFLLGEHHRLDAQLLLRWAATRQMTLEGGFQGRPNKLVDGCYSFWVGGVFPLLNLILAESGDLPEKGRETWLYNEMALQDYVLLCGQLASGGLRDKPGKSRDYYHTCYCLSGLTSAQHQGFATPSAAQSVAGLGANLLRQTHPAHNIAIDKAEKAKAFFARLQAAE